MQSENSLIVNSEFSKKLVKEDKIINNQDKFLDDSSDIILLDFIEPSKLKFGKRAVEVANSLNNKKIPIKKSKRKSLGTKPSTSEKIQKYVVNNNSLLTNYFSVKN